MVVVVVVVDDEETTWKEGANASMVVLSAAAAVMKRRMYDRTMMMIEVDVLCFYCKCMGRRKFVMCLGSTIMQRLPIYSTFLKSLLLLLSSHFLVTHSLTHSSIIIIIIIIKPTTTATNIIDDDNVRSMTCDVGCIHTRGILPIPFCLWVVCGLIGTHNPFLLPPSQTMISSRTLCSQLNQKDAQDFHFFLGRHIFDLVWLLTNDQLLDLTQTIHEIVSKQQLVKKHKTHK